MKHAILICTHNNEEITSKLLSLYDDENIDFYIHVDRKSENFRFDILNNVCKYSKVHFIERISVYWGTYSLIDCTVRLLEAAVKTGYDYYHLISGCDVPFYTKKEFLNFFEKHNGDQFVEYSLDEIFESQNIIERVKYYHVFVKATRVKNALIRKPQTFIRNIYLKLQKTFHMGRKIDFTVKYGSEWFDITDSFAKYIISKKEWIRSVFKLTCCGDEIFLQSLLYNSKFKDTNYFEKENDGILKAPRYVDWDRGQPYTFTNNDFDEIKSVKNCLFARKFDYKTNKDIVDGMFKYLEDKEDEV